MFLNFDYFHVVPCMRSLEQTEETEDFYYNPLQKLKGMVCNTLKLEVSKSIHLNFIDFQSIK